MISLKHSLLILFKSIVNRRLTSLLLIFSLSLSLLLLTGLLHVKKELKTSLGRSLSQTDLIVGSRSSSLQLLLTSVFKKGQLTQPLSAKALEKLQNLKDVQWVIPLSMGDSHQGFPVLATTKDYVEFFRFGRQKELSFKQGHWFQKDLEVVLGWDVAKKQGYQLGDLLYLAHGRGARALALHQNHAFKVVGILHPTATPVDQTLHVNLNSIKFIHGQDPSETMAVSAAFLGLKSAFSIFKVQRLIQGWEEEALSAIIPAQAFAEMATFLRGFEKILWIFAGFLFLCTLITMVLTFILSQQQRHQEFRILRALGASSGWIFFLLMAEAAFLSVLAFLMSRILLMVIHFSSHGLIKATWGLELNLMAWQGSDVWVALLMLVLTLLSASVPAWQSYRQAQSNTLSLLK